MSNRAINMFKHACLVLALVAAASCEEAKKPKQQMDDPFSLMDRLVHYVFPPRMKLWPWYDLFQAANPLEDPKLISNRNKCEIDLYVKRFEPEDLRVKVKNRHILVEGRKKASDGDSHFMVNRFAQNFVLPPGCKEDEVVAVYENGVLSVSAPKHELPPPPPERNIPIEVRKSVETTTEVKDEPSIATSTPLVSSTPAPLEQASSTPPPLEQLDLEATTTSHVGKIRKKDLKATSKVTKDNEVNKGDDNGLDYSVLDGEIE